MRKYCLLFCTVLLCALLCTGCAVSLTDALPPLDDAATKLQNVTSVTVCRHTDDAHVTLTDPMALDALYMQLDGIRGTREKMELAAYREAYPPLYTIVYANETGVIDVLILSGETTFYYDGYAYNALRGGADLFYFESLFAE